MLDHGFSNSTIPDNEIPWGAPGSLQRNSDMLSGYGRVNPPPLDCSFPRVLGSTMSTNQTHRHTSHWPSSSVHAFLRSRWVAFLSEFLWCCKLHSHHTTLSFLSGKIKQPIIPVAALGVVLGGGGKCDAKAGNRVFKKKGSL